MRIGQGVDVHRLVPDRRLFLGGVSKKEEIEKIRRDPPKGNEKGEVFPFGDKNPLSFAYDSESRTMTAWERMIKKRGAMGLWGLTGPEAAAALNAASSRHDRGGRTDSARTARLDP